MLKTPLKSPILKSPIGRTPIRGTPGPRSTPGKSRPGRLVRPDTVFKIAAPLIFITVLFLFRPHFGPHPHIDENSAFLANHERAGALVNGEIREHLAADTSGGGTDDSGSGDGGGGAQVDAARREDLEDGSAAAGGTGGRQAAAGDAASQRRPEEQQQEEHQAAGDGQARHAPGEGAPPPPRSFPADPTGAVRSAELLAALAEADGISVDPADPPPPLPAALASLAACDTLPCIKRAHSALAGRTRFNFPHFFLIGWQKCATTSVNLHLRYHPQFLKSPVKESHYWTTCQHFWNHHSCMAHNTTQYINEFLRLEEAVASNLSRVAVDASVDYAWKGVSLAPDLQRLFPWVKLVVIMREPLSRLISYVRMYTQRNDEVKGCLNGRRMYDCLQYHLQPSEANANYSSQLQAWFDRFPAHQFHVIQFEELQEDADGVARRLKTYLGMDPALPKKPMKNTNLRKSGGYDMTKDEYQHLVEQVRWDARAVAAALAERGLADKATWMGRWEAVWDANLETCDDEENCLVNSN